MYSTSSCNWKGCGRRTFMDSDRCFDHQYVREARWFGLGAVAIILVNLAVLALVVWAVISLVQWVTSK